MITLKFGGTSMESAARILGSAEIIIGRAEKERVSVVVSAVAGVSNLLQESIDRCAVPCCDSVLVEDYVKKIRDIHTDICGDITDAVSGFRSEKVLEALECYFGEYERLLAGCVAFGECTVTVHCRIMGMGELMSSTIMEEVLLAKKQRVALFDSRKYVFTYGDQKEGDADFDLTCNALAPLKDAHADAGSPHILLFQGFICSWARGLGKHAVMGLLGRNGSDFSAAIIATGLDSRKVEFWTDVDGIYSADPRVVKDAVLIDEMSYEEAIELAFFGSKVLHPKTITPLASKNIEVWSLNSHKPDAKGTRISAGKALAEKDRKNSEVRGISSLKDIALLSISGPGMKGKTGTASRIFEAVSSASISVLLITQSSSEYTVSFCVRADEADRAQDALTAEFDLEIRSGIIAPIESNKNCAIVSIVGDGMKKKRGVAGKFFNALAQQDININAIAQGSSERCISCVVDKDAADIAVRVVHRFFFNTAQTIEVFMFGKGTIGGALLDQIRAQRTKLLWQNIDIRVLAIAASKKMIVNVEGLDLSNWRADIEKSEEASSVDEIIKFVRQHKPLNPVFVDCTASYDLPERYLDILKAGMSIATPNKRANSMNIEFYREMRHTANVMHRRFLYETNVGAGLPIIDTLQNLFKSGDRLTGFNGIMSGSLSYIFGRLDEGASFSEAVLEAKAKGFTEPDPRDDLSGMDVARKALIIAREAGHDVELDEIEMISVFPKDFDSSGTTEEFLARLPQMDDYFAEKVAALKKEGKVLRMGASIKDGKCSVGILEADQENPLYGVKGGENAFVFFTERYTPIPLTVRGYGAGAEVTAAGVFGDILRTVSFNP